MFKFLTGGIKRQKQTYQCFFYWSGTSEFLNISHWDGLRILSVLGKHIIMYRLYLTALEKSGEKRLGKNLLILFFAIKAGY